MGYDKDVMTIAVVGKLLVFALAFLLLWFGNRRGWKWYILDKAIENFSAKAEKFFIGYNFIFMDIFTVFWIVSS